MYAHVGHKGGEAGVEAKVCNAIRSLPLELAMLLLKPAHAGGRWQYWKRKQVSR